MQKFAYLRSCLKGSALTAIDGYSVTSANYAEAIQVLGNRFGRPDLAIEAHVTGIIEIEQIDQLDVASLRQLQSKLESHIRSLAGLGKDLCKGELTAEEVLIALLKTKLPVKLRKK